MVAVLMLHVATARAEPTREVTDGGPVEAAAAPVEAAAAAPAADADAPEIGSTVVTGLRLPRPLRDVPVAVTVLDRAEIERSPRRLADDLLRMVPSAATFRRSSSLAADPSSQGVNLRGVGPSGVSRALVLLDGVPINDPFGGWVYWRALPLSSIERVEIASSGASALFGNFALGGVVQFLSRPADERGVEATVSTGSFATHRGAARVSDQIGPLAVALDADVLDSQGYNPIAPAARGAIDGPAASRHFNLGGRVEASPATGVRLRGHARFFGETLEAGTRHTSAGVWSARYGVGLTRVSARGVLEAKLFGGVQRFRQTRARVAPDRASAEVAARQRVPSNSAGAAVSFQAAPIAAAGEHVLLTGLDLLRVAGSSREVLSPPSPEPSSIVERAAGGEQRFLGVFAQDAVRLARSLQATAAVRLDVWRVVDGERTVVRDDGGERRENLAARREMEVSPRVGLLWRPTEAVAFRGSGFRAFRAPTLNELYRPFQVGTVLTESNSALAAETLVGVEAGPEVVIGPLVARAMGFWNRIDEPIQNVTLAMPLPSGATRQRQNLGRARVAGIELEAGVRPAEAWLATAGYTFVDPTVTAAPGQPELVGRRLAQAPRHRVTATLTFDDPAIVTATVSWRRLGGQFEDDLNTLPMPAFSTIDVLVARRLGRSFRGFVTVENLLDREYLVGRAGVDTVGQPLTVQVGVGFDGS
jgi:iron complex outermembrane recepter protein